MLLKSEEEALVQGDKAPDFSLKNVDGNTISLSDFKGKPVAVIFMCNHCPYVKPKFQKIGDLQGLFEGKAVILCINSNATEGNPESTEEDSFNNMKKIAKDFGYKYYLHDESQEVAKEYGAVCTPDPFLLDREHRLTYHGRINNAMNPDDSPSTHDLKVAIQKTIAGQEIDPWFNPSMGCSIKWKN